MGWIQNTVDALKEHAGHDPIECPRGWGSVSFVGSVWLVPPLFWIERNCPIAGVSNCTQCKHASAVDPLRIAEQLSELEGMLADKRLTTEEHRRCRSALLDAQGMGTTDLGWLLCSIWIVGGIGALTVIAGWLLVERVHVGFWGLVAGGAVMLIVAAGLAARYQTAKPTGSRGEH